MNTIQIDQVIIPSHHRQVKPWVLRQVTESIQDHGFNSSYPITLDGDTLVDGRHRLEAARACGLVEVPFVNKPDNVPIIRHSIQCNQDQTLGTAHDVFDYAELCWGLAQEGLEGKQIAYEVCFNDLATVTRYINIKAKLHRLAWGIARFGLTKDPSLVNDDQNDLVKQELTIVNWRETYFRSLLSHLSLNGQIDHAVMRSQVATIREALNRFASPDKKVTAKWIGEVAQRYAWQVELGKYMRDNLALEVPLKERKDLLSNVKRGVFGNTPDDKNLSKFQAAVAAINQRVLGVKLYQDDSFQRIPLLADKSVALIVTDPPYNVTDNEWDKIGTDEQYLEWLAQWLDLIRPKLKDDYHLFLFCSPEYQARIELLLVDKGWPLKSRITWWHKNMSMGRDVSDKFICNDERVFHCGTHPLNWSPEWDKERFAVQEWAAPQSNFKEGKNHPTAKPVGLIEHFVRIGSKPGDIILDTFAGGGTTGEACKNINQRQCILIEQSNEYCDAIEQRLGIKRIKEISIEAGD